MEEVIKLNAVDQYNKMFGLETLHPLVSVVDLSEATGYPRHFTLNYGVYALFLKNTTPQDTRIFSYLLEIRNLQEINF